MDNSTISMISHNESRPKSYSEDIKLINHN